MEFGADDCSRKDRHLPAPQTTGWGIDEMNAALDIAVTLAGLVGFGRIFLADEGASHRLSGALILAGLVGKVALSI